MMQLPLSGKYAVGDYQFAMVDDEDYSELCKHSWRIFHHQKSLMIQSHIGKKFITLQRYITKTDKAIIYKDGNRLNNQKSNLIINENIKRKVSRPTGTIKFKDSTSRFYGVHFHKKEKRWRVSIYVNGTTKYLGSAKTETEAAEIYDINVIKYYGNSSKLNFPERLPEYLKELEEKVETQPVIEFK